MRSGEDVGYGFFMLWAGPMQECRQAEWSGALSAAMRNGCRRGCGTTASGRWKALFSGLRHTSSERAAKHTVKAALLWQLGGVKQVCLLSFSEEELCDREPFDEMHESMAARALP